MLRLVVPATAGPAVSMSEETVFLSSRGITLVAHGIAPDQGAAVVADIAEEFRHRFWLRVVACSWSSGVVSDAFGWRRAMAQ